MAEKVKVLFLRDILITIVKSRFNSHPHCTLCCILG